MQDERLRLVSTNSAFSTDKKQIIDLDVKQHSKILQELSFFDTIDQQDIFEKEVKNSSKYRLILTVKPYCSNILFNPITEIVQNEGTNKPGELKIISETPINVSIKGYNIRGKHEKVKSVDMVRNTEYSNGETPFVYHCGYDMFNNHILRNKSFKAVNQLKSSEDRDVFNTIFDYMRDKNGDNIKLTKRNSVTEIVTQKKKHLYLKDDIMPYIDSINANLKENNGWWGFNNTSQLPIYSWDDESRSNVDMNISKVFNGDKSSCDFIELYPDSSLFSFNPKYNPYQFREEHNWDVCITYPFRNDSDVKHILINGLFKNGENVEKLNSLLLESGKQTIGKHNEDIIMFKSYVKHNLRVGDTFKLFYLENGKGFFEEFDDTLFIVTNIGDLNGDNKDYYFYINNVTPLTDKLSNVINDENYVFRFIKVVEGVECEYYFRKFKKLPNFKFSKTELTEDISLDNEKFDKHVKENAIKNGKYVNFSREQYPLGFSKTIYSDAVTEITFTDDIDIRHIKDNNNRPLSSIYVTFIKRNKGHDLWYKTPYNNKNKEIERLTNIEYSHCFGELISGINIFSEKDDKEENRKKREFLSDIRLLNNSNKEHALDLDITLENTDEFYGDVVEFSKINITETVLSDVFFRFNTEQREHGWGKDDEISCNKLYYDEILMDDYDLAGFVCKTYDMDEKNLENDKLTVNRKEGYFYKPHYKIDLKGVSNIKQGYHKQISVNNTNIVNANGLELEIVSDLSLNLNKNDKIIIFDYFNKIFLDKVSVNSILSKLRFTIGSMNREKDTYKTLYDLAEGIMFSKHTITDEDIKNNFSWLDKDGKTNTVDDLETPLGVTIEDYNKPKYILYVENIEIPKDAISVADNVFLWREVINNNYEDAKNYPFANGCFYIYKDLNFFLKRQDPFGYNGLYDKKLIPNDIYGKMKKNDIHDYKEVEKEDLC